MSSSIRFIQLTPSPLSPSRCTISLPRGSCVARCSGDSSYFPHIRQLLSSFHRCVPLKAAPHLYLAILLICGFLEVRYLGTLSTGGTYHFVNLPLFLLHQASQKSTRLSISCSRISPAKRSSLYRTSDHPHSAALRALDVLHSVSASRKTR